MSCYYQRKTIPIPMMSSRSVDWSAIVSFIIRQGVPKARIARAVDCSREHVGSLLDRRVEPNWSVGQNLLALKTHLELEGAINAS
mgnify:CR=1 FL=1